MDRDETVRISRLAAFGGLTESDANIVLMQYCIEHGKPYYETSMFVMNMLKSKQLLAHCLSIALSFYERKFTVCKLWSAPNPLNIQGKKENYYKSFKV